MLESGGTAATAAVALPPVGPPRYAARVSSGQASGWPPAFMGELERGQERLTRAALALGQDYDPEGDIEPAARAIEDAFAAVYDAFDERSDGLEAVQRGLSAIDLAIRLLVVGGELPAIRSAVAMLEKAKAHLAGAHDDLASRPPRPIRAVAEEIRGSDVLPRLHQVVRASLRPRVLVPSPPPPPPAEPEPVARPKTFEALRQTVADLEKRAEARRLAGKSKPALAEKPAVTPALPPGGFAPELPPHVSELRFIEDRTRELLEEVAMIGLQRAPLLGDPWRLALGLEQRMFRAIDGIAAMGPRAVAAIEQLSRDAPVKDATRVFAAGMVLGCLAGRDALAASERVFFETELVDPEARHGLAAAYKLVPHDLLPLTLRTLLGGGNPAHRALAIEVLAHRGLASDDELMRAAADVPLVASIALPHLAARRAPALRELSTHAVGAGDRDLRHAAWVAQCTSGDGSVGRGLRESIEDDPRALLLLALWGDDRDAQLLLDRLQSLANPELVFATGWTGHVGSLAALVSLLEGDDPRLALAAAYALERITGAGLVAELEVEAEAIEVPEPPDPDVGEEPRKNLVALTSDARDLPPAPSTETVEQPSTDPARWQAWLREHGERFRAGHRYRRGRPYSPAVSLWELDQGPCTPGERRALQRELVIRTGSVVPFDPHDFVVIQEGALAAWAPVAERASSQAGSWSRPLPR